MVVKEELVKLQENSQSSKHIAMKEKAVVPTSIPSKSINGQY